MARFGFLQHIMNRLRNKLIAPYLLDSRFAHAVVQFRHFFWSAFSALRVNQVSGAYAEFGTYGAASFSHAYTASVQTRSRRPFWGFDSFQGLPAGTSEMDEHPRWEEGRFKKNQEEFRERCRKWGVPDSAYRLVPGFFKDSLARLGPDAEPTDIAFAFVDCDLYSSTIDVLNFLEPRLKHGMIIGFDDYFLFSEKKLSSEKRAFLELFGNHPQWCFEPFLPINWHGQSFIVEARASYPPTHQ